MKVHFLTDSSSEFECGCFNTYIYIQKTKQNDAICLSKSGIYRS